VEVRRPGASLDMLVPLLYVALAVGLVLYFVSPLMCLAAPSQSGARGWAAAYLSMIVLVVVCLVIYVLGQWANTEARLRHVHVQVRDFGGPFGQPPPAEFRPLWNEKALWAVLMAAVGFGIVAQAFVTLALLQTARHLHAAGTSVGLMVYLPIALLFQLAVAALVAVQTLPGPVRFQPRLSLPYRLPWLVFGAAWLLQLWLLVLVAGTRTAVSRAMLRLVS
jgi:hypothetical protein